MTEKGPGELSKRRLGILIVGVFCAFTLLIGRLFYIQIVDGENLQQKALKQWAREFTVTAKRGEITDRNGKVLAQSASAATVIATPSDVRDRNKDEEQFYQKTWRLAEILGLDYDGLLAKLSDTTKGQQVLARQISLEKADEIRAINFGGIAINEDSVRAYPQGSFLTQVLGFTDISGQGQEGLEKSLNKYLAGTNGRIVSQVDAENRQMSAGADEYIEPEDGYTVKLTIDYVIQSIAEKAAERALRENGAKGVEVVVMDPKTGEILAMTNKPDFDLNAPPRDDLSALSKLMRNSTVVDAYEPGSTFKILTTALALNEGVATMNSGFHCSGYVMVDGDKIKCWRSSNPHGHQSLQEAVNNSCNPAFIELALRLGIERFYKGLDSFGIGRDLGVDMPGASSGQLIPIKYVKNVDLARVGFGQSVAVSPIQLLTAASAAVNGGRLMKPHIVKEMLDSEGMSVVSYAPEQVGQPITEESSALMRKLLEGAVTDGGGRNAYIPGYRVGGKTGTAQKYVNGKVSSDVHICSFLGFAPMDDPQVAVLFIVDEPSVRPDFGSTVAAPFAKDLLSDTLKHLGIQPKYKDGEKDLVGKTTTVPNVVGESIGTASAALSEAGLKAMTDGIGSVIVEQLPAAGAEVPEGSLVVLYTERLGAGEQETQGWIEVPDLKGLSMISANRLLRDLGLTMKIEGSGLAVSQEPKAGTRVDPNINPDEKEVKVRFEKP
ncbi:MAG: PASTA domain-containing protein [Christensenellaceae bacterium]|nr:PASTA domain-containing protein [Christensenellaceae bacterium]